MNSSNTLEEKTLAEAIGITELERLYSENGGAFYLLDMHRIQVNIEGLLSEFTKRYKRTSWAHPYKTNHIPSLCTFTYKKGAYAEVASKMEFELALRQRIDPKRIIVNGPAKGPDFLHQACKFGAIVNADSVEEAASIANIATAHPDEKYRIGLRCNIELPGKPRSRFGIDTENGDIVEAANLLRKPANIILAGLHCHIGGDRTAASYQFRMNRLIEIARVIFGKKSPEFLDVGGGFAGQMPYSLAKQFSSPIPTVSDYADAIGSSMNIAFGGNIRPELIIEPGIALFADVMEYVCKIVATKKIAGTSLAMASGNIYDVKPALHRYDLPMTVIRHLGKESRAAYDWIIGGNSCVENDVLSRRYSGPLNVDDFLVFSNVGAYTIVLRPPFIDYSPAIVSAGNDGKLSVVRRRESLKEMFASYSFR